MLRLFPEWISRQEESEVILPSKRMTALAVLAAVCTSPRATGATTKAIHEPIGRHWRGELVHWEVFPARGEATGMPHAQVRAADGTEVPCQISDVRRHAADGSVSAMYVWHFVDLPANGTASFAITPGKTSAAPPTAVHISESKGDLVLANSPEGVGIVLPGGTEAFAWPVPAVQVAAPVRALVLASGKRAGTTRFEVPFRVRSRTTEVLANGPLFAEARVRYEFDVGVYSLTARVVRDCPTVILSEELNTGDSGQTAREFDRFWTLAFDDDGFRPTQAFAGVNNPKPEFTGLVKRGIPHPDVAQAAGIRGNWFATNINGYALSFDETRHEYSLSGYPAAAPQVGMLIRYVQPGGDAVGFLGLDTAWWRNPLAVRCGVEKGGAVSVRFPLQNYSTRWGVDGWERISPNYTGTLRFVPENHVRRRYGVVLTRAEDETEALCASMFEQHRRLSALPLDTVKDRVLDWPDPMAQAEWAANSTEAGAEALSGLRAKIAATWAYGHLGAYSMGYHYGYAKGLYGQIAAVIDAPDRITVDERRELRRLAAFWAYDMNGADTFPYGTGFHLNNPNMTIMAVEARVKSSALVKDHVMFAEWGAWTRELMSEYFARFTKSSGAPFENPHYTLGVTMNWAIQANELLMDNGLGDALDSDLFRRSIRFAMNWLTPPDRRFNGHRVILPLGNGSYQSVPEDFTKRFVAYFQARDPELAGQLQWYGNQTVPESKQVALVESRRPELMSGWHRGYGVIFRHGYGTEHETLVHFLAGECFGHYELETDQMAYTIYAKGQPIHLHFGNGYFPIWNRPWLRNRVSFGMKLEAPERNRIEVEAAAFSPETEYFRAVREFEQLLDRGPEYPVLDDKRKWAAEEKEAWGTCMAQWDTPAAMVPLTVWQRQMVLLKDPDPSGPNYFVLRDTFDGKPTVPAQLNLWFLAQKMTEDGGTVHFTGQLGVDMDVFVATPESFSAHTAEYGHQQQPYRRLTGFDPKFHPDGKLWESQLLLRIEQPPGKGFLTVLYPRIAGKDPAAVFTRLSHAAVLVETPLARDFVFLDSFPVMFASPDVSFNGQAGTVRFFRDGRTVVCNSEGPASVRVGEHRIDGHGAFTVTIEGDTVTKEIFEAGAAVKVEQR